MEAKEKARLQREITDILQRYQGSGYFPSASVRVFDRHETLAAAWVGDAREDSLFDVASLTKIATATQIFHLIRQGRMTLQTALRSLLPEIEGDPYLRERMRDISLFQLLTHTSTLPAWYPFYSRQGQDFYAVLAYALQHTEPTRGMVYSDLNFMLLGKVIEKAYGKPLDRCLQEELVDPLRLGQMTYHPDPGSPVVPSSYGNPIEKQMCRDRGISFAGFRPDSQPVAGQANDGNCFYYFGGVSGHAGIFAHPAAYERLCQYYMTASDPLLIEAQREQPGAPGRGLGFQMGISYPHGCGHTGFTGTGIYFSSTCGIGVVSFTNRLFYPEGNSQQTWEFRRALHEAVFALGAERY